MPNPQSAPAPGGRATPEVIREQARLIESIATIPKILNAAPVIAMVLNQERQIVALNQHLLEVVGAAAAEDVLGLRPGEALECRNAADAENGCGTGQPCGLCGALGGILNSQAGRANVQICRLRRLTSRGEECLNLEIHATPLALGDEQFTLLFASDIGGRVRAEFLEHGILPEAVARAAEIELLAAGLAAGNTPEVRERIDSALAAAAARLTSVLTAYGEIAEAEAGWLRIAPQGLSALGALHDAQAGLRFDDCARDRELRIAPDAEDAEITTDPAQLGKILHGMARNALEASPPHSVVTLGCRRTGEHAEFRVHNDGEIPDVVQLQIFQRAFSTKGPGRGFGAYRMKLIAERYLGGTVSFRSSRQEGTTFVLSLPLAGSRAPGCGE